MEGGRERGGRERNLILDLRYMSKKKDQSLMKIDRKEVGRKLNRRVV
jgi:hypothetical protein